MKREQKKWKIKIIDRCPLKNDGKLNGYSKVMKNIEERNPLTVL